MLQLILICLFLVDVSAFFNSMGSSRSHNQMQHMQLLMANKPAVHRLVLIRHGLSTWNELNKFTGWADVPLSETGIQEAEAGGELMKKEGYKFDLAYTSVLKRAIKTLHIGLEAIDQLYLPVIKDWRLNERHYGGLQGLDKQETVNKYGKDQVLIWRRSYDIPPPTIEDKTSEHYPGNDPKYSDLSSDVIPLTESLKDTEARFMPYYYDEIAPQIKDGKNLLISAHGNTLRALVKNIDNIPEDVIANLNIPTAIPLVYDLDEDLNVVPSPDAIAPLQGKYLGNQEEIRARIQGVANQTK